MQASEPIEPVPTEDGNFTCDRCGNGFLLGGYIGPVDRKDRSCNPFQNFEYICGECENG